MKNKWLHFFKFVMASSFMSAGIVASAQTLKTSPIFASGMVLQRDVVVPIWGTTDANAEVTVSWNGVEAKSTADETGAWKVNFPATNYGGPYTMTIQTANASLEYTDVYFGEVFYCSGQSNMELEVQSCNDFSSVKAAANDETIRQMKVAKGTSYELSNDLPTVTWRPATSLYVGGFSAAAYFCVLELKKLDEYKDIPFGILNNSYGGARVEAWMSKEMLGYDAYDITLAQGEKERQPTLIYNKMVNPIIGIPFKAMLWYQAESNCDGVNDAKVYSEQFNNMITSYRKLWNNEFPVVWVQLPNYKDENRDATKDNVESSSIATDAWIVMREEQTKSLSVLPKSAQIVTIDAGLAGNIHPTDKQTIGKRLSIAVRKLVYNDSKVDFTPQFNGFVKNEDGSVTIDFKNIGEGLCLYVNEKTSDYKLNGKLVDGNKVTWFQVTDVNGKSSIANATLADNKVTIAKGDADIATVYYAWNRCPNGMNLYAKVGDDYLPMTPFSFNVDVQSFGIKSFTASKTDEVIEGGTFVTFSWNAGGNVTAYFDGVQVDPNTSAKVMMSQTKDYVLKIVDNDNADNVDTQTIHFTVVPAKPTIKLSSKSGLLATIGDEVEILSNAAAPGGFAVQKVEFYLNDELYQTSDVAPFSCSWVAPSALGDYKFYGIVYNNNSDQEYNSKQSDILTITVTDMEKTRFEAEKATLKDNTGSTIKSDANCSNSKYYDLHEFSYLMFTGVIAPEDGDYQVCVACRAPYGYKEATFYVNSISNAKTITMEESQDWEIQKMVFSLKKGENKITIKSAWGWQQYDYIDILGVTNAATAIDDVQNAQSMSAYCDTQKTIVVQYQTELESVSFALFDGNGKKVFQSAKVDATGIYTIDKQFEPGMYVVKMTVGKEVFSQQVLVK